MVYCLIFFSVHCIKPETHYGFLIKQIDSIVPWVCSIIDRRRRQNVVKTSVTQSPLINTFWRHLWSITEQYRRMATLNLFVKFQFLFFGQGPTLTETINETVTSFYFKVSILDYVQTNLDTFETTYFLTRIGLASTRNQWIRSQKPPLSRAVKDPVRVHTSLLESSSNARVWGGALRDKTKNGCVTHYVHMNPDKNMPF